MAEGSGAQAKEGRYFTFALGNEEYALEIRQVREIIGLMEITPVPQAANYVKGVINLRGKIIPVIDIRLKFGMPAVDYTRETCIIVLHIKEILAGIIVDRVCEVLDISADNIEPAPAFCNNLNTGLILGMGKIAERVVIILDIEKILLEDATSVLK
ncbi:MAG: purine-binding chemotaxis protein CheW [Candidatus Omnitrophica bacterium]|nr:purine-binding chemotaxis protein CheW [Candidatus Omnitrophota bacterium]